MVPKSPIEQPSKHHKVFNLAFFQVDLHFQEIELIINLETHSLHQILGYRFLLISQRRIRHHLLFLTF